MPTPEIDIDKTLLYKLCKFLSEKAWERKGIHRPVSIAILDFTPLLDYVHKETALEKWKVLHEELEGLMEEKEPDDHNQTLLRIEGLSRAFPNRLQLPNPTKRLTLRYDREQIEKYAEILKLRKPDMNIAQGLSCEVKDDKVIVHLHGKSMEIRYVEGINAGCLLLLIGKKAITDRAREISIQEYASESTEDIEAPEDYQRGVKVSVQLLAKIILEDAWSSHDQNERKKLKRRIRDALNKLNKRAIEALGEKLFDITGGKVVQLI